MKLINRKRYIVLFLISIITISLILYACKSKAYYGKHFSYPPNSKLHESNWKYRGFVKITSNKSGAFSNKSKKHIRIEVIDKEKNNYLNDELDFNCGGIDIIIKWEKFEILNIILNEVGSEYVNDNYNKQLIKEGPRDLINLKYNFNHSLNRFVLVD